MDRKGGGGADDVGMCWSEDVLSLMIDEILW